MFSISVCAHHDLFCRDTSPAETVLKRVYISFYLHWQITLRRYQFIDRINFCHIWCIMSIQAFWQINKAIQTDRRRRQCGQREGEVDGSGWLVNCPHQLRESALHVTLDYRNVDELLPAGTAPPPDSQSTDTPTRTHYFTIQHTPPSTTNSSHERRDAVVGYCILLGRSCRFCQIDSKLFHEMTLSISATALCTAVVT